MKTPAGTTTRPPPARLQASIALRIASVLSKSPPARAPKSVMGQSRAGNFGGLMRARMDGIAFQPITLPARAERTLLARRVVTSKGQTLTIRAHPYSFAPGRTLVMRQTLRFAIHHRVKSRY